MANVDQEVVKKGLCTGCGVCQNTCKNGAIQMELRWDSWKPVIQRDICVSDKGCSRCISACPGLGIDIDNYGNKLFPELENDRELGRYSSLYTGFSTDDTIRFHSASGGMVSSFLIYLLEKGYIEGAVLTRFREDNPTVTEGIIAKTREDILDAKSSKYCPVSLDGVYNDIIHAKGKFVIVGLPCHLHGFRKLSNIDSKFSNKIFAYFGIYCGSTKTSLLPDYLVKKNGVKPEDLTSFAFRDEGYPGYLKMATNTNEEAVKVHFHEYYIRLRSFFTYHRCLLCFDHTAELSDISFGDIHIPEFLDDKLGTNSIIVRNNSVAKLLNQAVEDGYIQTHPVDREKIYRSQSRMIYMKKQRIFGAYLIRKLQGKKVPEFGSVFSGRATLNDVISVCVGLCQGFVGKHRCLWSCVEPIAALLNKVVRSNNRG